VVALTLRTVDRDLYSRFYRGEVTDMEVVDSVFGRTEAKSIQGRREGNVFEATVIGAGYELKGSVEWNSSLSPLVAALRDAVERS
jgi:hypothetical protein